MVDSQDENASSEINMGLRVRLSSREADTNWQHGASSNLANGSRPLRNCFP
jgi:hypothetical protein